MVNVIIAYILWFFGGIFGVHHLYLRRDNQALVWWTTLAGCGIGWFRDLWRIPSYVRQANNEPSYVDEIKELKRIYKKPPFSYERIITEIFVSSLLAYLFYSAWSVDLLKSYGFVNILVITVLTPLVAAYGVLLVANIGEQRADFKLPVIGSFLGIPFYLKDPTQIIYSSLISTAFLNYFNGTRWRDISPNRPQRTGCLKRTLRITSFCFVYLSLWALVINHNASVRDSTGKERKLSEVIIRYFSSEEWQQTKESIWFLYEYGSENGWTNLADAIWKIFATEDVPNAYKVLGLSPDATQEEIKSKYRNLVKKWHPDKHKDANMKKLASNHFMAIQNAYNILTKNSHTKTRTP
ncbi:dnaJ homolog subfamily C member 22-like [Argonauta hians]